MSHRDFVMPKLVRVNIKEVNQHENVLGHDEDNSKLDVHSLRVKYKNALYLFNALAGYGVKERERGN